MIRAFEKEDIDRVMEIWLDTNKKAHSFIPDKYWEDNEKTVRNLILRAEIYLCERENIIVGFIGLMDDYIAGLFVADGFQSKGAGKEILDYVKTLKPSLNLYAYEKNSRAVNFYTREGFIKKDETLDEIHNEKEYHMEWKK